MSTLEALSPDIDASVPAGPPSLSAACRAVLRDGRLWWTDVLGQAALAAVVLAGVWLVTAGGTINGLPVLSGYPLFAVIVVAAGATLRDGAWVALTALRGRPARRPALDAAPLAAVVLTGYLLAAVFGGQALFAVSAPAAIALTPVAIIGLHLCCWLQLAGIDSGGNGLALRRVGSLARAAGWRTWGPAVVGALVLPGLSLGLGYLLFRLATDEAVSAVRWVAVCLAMLALFVLLVLTALAVLLIGAVSALAYRRAESRRAESRTAPTPSAALDGLPPLDRDAGSAQERVERRRDSGRVLAWRVGAAMLLVAATAVVIVNPRGASGINLVSLPDEVVAMGLPAGQQPVLVTRRAVLDCQDSGCASFAERPLNADSAGPQISAVDAAVAADGSALLLVEDLGAQQLRLIRCGRAGDCQDGAMVHDLSAHPSGTYAAAIGLSPSAGADGPIGVVTVTGTGDDYRIKVLSCVDIRCEGAAPHDFGGIGRFDGPGVDVVDILVDEQGLPTVGYHTYNHDVFVGVCDSAACESPQLTQVHAGSTTPVDSDRRLGLALQDGQPIVYDQSPVTGPDVAGTIRLTRCSDARCAAAQPVDYPATWIGPALAVSGRRVHAAAIADGKLVVRSCAAYDCVTTRLIDLTEAAGAQLVVAPDGRTMVSYRKGDDAWLVSYA